MADVFLGIMGAVVGSLLGNPMLGFSIGMTLGGLLFPPDLGNTDVGKLADRKITGASPGNPLPIVYGRYRVSPSIVWAPNLEEVVNVEEVGGKGGGGATITRYTYFADYAAVFCEGEILRFNKVWADAELIYDYNGGSPTYAEWVGDAVMEFHLGGEAQAVDALIDAERTAAGDEAPAYRGCAYISFDSINWSKFGRIPNFTAEVVTASSVTLEDVLDDLFDRAGVDPSLCDFSEVGDVSITGFAVMQRTNLLDALAPLMRAYHFDIVETDGLLYARKKVQAPSFAIAEGDLNASSGGEKNGDLVQIRRRQETDLPVQVDVLYWGVGNDFQQFTQTAQRQGGTSAGANKLNLALPLVLPDDDARRIAFTTLFEAWIARTVYRVSLPISYLGIAPGDVGTLPVNGTTRTVRCVRQALSMIGHIEMEFVEHDNDVYTQVIEGEDASGGAGVFESGTFLAEVLHENALRDADADEYLLYGVAAQAGGNFKGGAFKINEVDNSAYYGDIIDDGVGVSQSVGWGVGGYMNGTSFSGWSTDLASIIGEALTELADAPESCWDRVNTVEVEIVRGTLESITEAEVLSGRNLALLGDELIQFQTVELIGTNQYRLSNLVRGRRSTGHNTDTHAIGERFVLISQSAIGRVPIVKSAMGKQFEIDVYNAATLTTRDKLTLLPAISIDPFTWKGGTRKPWSPCDLRASRDMAGEITLTWVRRARKPGNTPALHTPELDETSELYDLQIMNGGAVVRTVTGLTSPTWVYSVADQTTDFGSAQASVKVRVYQVSPTLNGFYPTGKGRGHPHTATV